MADNGADKFGQMCMIIDKTTGYVLASVILNYVVFIKVKQMPED